MEKFCQAEKNQRKKFVFPDRREGKQLFYTERSEVKTVFLTGERVKHFFRGFFSGQAKIFSCDRILFFGKVASDHTIRSVASSQLIGVNVGCHLWMATYPDQNPRALDV